MHLVASATAALAALFMVVFAGSATAAIRIADDPGGQIGTYVARYLAIRQSGQNVIIDGPCISACTMILGLLPRERVCVTPRAVFGFHAAWRRDDSGQMVTSNGGTRLLWEIYPVRIRNWLARKGGLSRKMLLLRGRDLASIYAPCRHDGVTTARRTQRVKRPPSNADLRPFAEAAGR
ncbi:MAG: hypothetical protein HY056_08710 [Proteobacteria bacterium]|nr:hypothetical protein [Pseudomonadota bacterium]